MLQFARHLGKNLHTVISILHGKNPHQIMEERFVVELLVHEKLVPSFCVSNNCKDKYCICLPQGHFNTLMSTNVDSKSFEEFFNRHSEPLKFQLVAQVDLVEVSANICPILHMYIKSYQVQHEILHKIVTNMLNIRVIECGYADWDEKTKKCLLNKWNGGHCTLPTCMETSSI